MLAEVVARCIVIVYGFLVLAAKTLLLFICGSCEEVARAASGTDEANGDAGAVAIDVYYLFFVGHCGLMFKARMSLL